MQKIKLIHQIRAVKNKKELENIIKAQRIAELVLADVLDNLKTGVTELEIANFIKKSFIKYKAPILSFPPIVAFGKNTANIHHEPSKSKLKKGDTIMLDFGCTVNHYCSDMTRTYFFGEPSLRQKKVYLAVLEAQNRAEKLIQKGEKRAKVIDSAARKFLFQQGKRFHFNATLTRSSVSLAKSSLTRSSTSGATDPFPHGLGHGVGTVIHEWPNFKPKSEDILPVGCVMTIEPGLYFKNFGGIRIEDMVLITKNGCINLTKAPKDLDSVILK